MVTGIIGRKVGMTQVFESRRHRASGHRHQGRPCVVVQAKTAQADGYEAIQLGLVEETPAKTNKPTQGHFKKANVPRRACAARCGSRRAPKREGRSRCSRRSSPPATVERDRHRPRQGFQGVVKRHHFAAARRRMARCSIARRDRLAASSFPSRVVKACAPRDGWAQPRAIHN